MDGIGTRPAIVEFPVTTLVVRPGQHGHVDSMGNVNVVMEANA